MVHLICRRDNLKSYIAKVQPHNEIKEPHRVLPNVSQCCKITTTTGDILANILLNARLLWWIVANPKFTDYFLQHSEKQTTNKQNNKICHFYASGDLLSKPAENQRLHKFV